MAAITSPSLFVTLHFLIGANTVKEASFLHTVSLSRFLVLLLELFFFSLDTFTIWQCAPWAVLVVVLYVLIRTPLTHQPGIERNYDVRRCTRMTVLAVTLVYFLAPNDFAGGSLFNQRLPWVLFLLLLPLLTVPATGFIFRHQGMLFPGLALVSLSVNGVVLHGESLRIDEYLAGMKAEIPQGSWIASFKYPDSSWSRIDPLLHAASYYGVEKGCVDVGNYEAIVPHFPVRFRPGGPVRPD
ncbi:MAG: hypothetical protein GYA56_00515 [Geobacteraceae bacterium]|nr:hypothetical protein [Geobacteraceae bacterium]